MVDGGGFHPGGNALALSRLPPKLSVWRARMRTFRGCSRRVLCLPDARDVLVTDIERTTSPNEEDAFLNSPSVPSGVI